MVITHFDKYPLISKKRVDYELWKRVIVLIRNKEHLTPEGLLQIVSIRSAINLGLSDVLKAAFANVVSVDIPSVCSFSDCFDIDPQWLAGFVSAEGCFLINTFKATTKVGMAVRLVFQITQHVRDERLMTSLIDYLGCGGIFKDKEAINFKVTKFEDLTDKIIPFFTKHSILGVKALDFADFVRVADLMKDKSHLSKEGLYQIHQIKESMNKGR